MIARVQEHLEAIYHLERQERAAEFVVGEDDARLLGASGRCDEELLVLEENGELEVALYLAPGLLERLKEYESAPPAAVLGDALAPYCQLAEGVSHFLYLLHAAKAGQQVSLLELETQAEVDKFACCLLARWSEPAAAWAEELHWRLFDQVSYNPALSAPERTRYEEANRLSRAYCQRLIRHVASRQMDRLLTELRYSYRLGAEAKLRYLGRAA